MTNNQSQPPTPENQAAARDNTLSEIKVRQEEIWTALSSGKEYKRPVAHAVIKAQHRDIKHLLSLLQQPATSERYGECAECGHNKGVDPRGRCLETQRDPGGSMVYCGHKCVYPATGAGEGEQSRCPVPPDWRFYDTQLRATGYTDLANRLRREFNLMAATSPAPVAEGEAPDSDFVMEITTPSPAAEAQQVNQAAIDLLNKWLAEHPQLEHDEHLERRRRAINENSLSDREHYPSTATTSEATAGEPEHTRLMFEAWWRVNHPWDWWAKERVDGPLPECDRLLVRELCERASWAAAALNVLAAGEVERLNQRIAELERRLRIPFGKLPCALCGGPHDFDTSVPSVIWNSVIRTKNLPDYLCTTCIVREFVRTGHGFTAMLWNEEFNGVPIEVVVNGQHARDAAAVQEENNSLRTELSTAQSQLARYREQLELLDDPDGLYAEVKRRIETAARADALMDAVEQVAAMPVRVVEGAEHAHREKTIRALQSLLDKKEGEDGPSV